MMQIFTYSCLEALNIGSQDGVSYVRRPFNPFQHCTVVCHLKNKPTRSYAQTLSHKRSFWAWIANPVLLCGWKSQRLCANTLLRIITWATHFEDTKLVASIAGRPVWESMSISWILTSVGTISCRNTVTQKLNASRERAHLWATTAPWYSDE